MTRFIEPLALQIHRRHSSGETIQQIAQDLRLPIERVRQRLSAAVLVGVRNGNIVADRRASREVGVTPN